MIVDDDPDILFTFKSILELAGYHVKAFSNSNEALIHFKQVNPFYYKLVLTDIKMPKINGFQLYSKFKEINTDIRVLFTTAFETTDNMRDRIPDLNDGDIIRKPVEEEHFVNRINRAIKCK